MENEDIIVYIKKEKIADLLHKSKAEIGQESREELLSELKSISY